MSLGRHTLRLRQSIVWFPYGIWGQYYCCARRRGYRSGWRVRYGSAASPGLHSLARSAFSVPSVPHTRQKYRPCPARRWPWRGGFTMSCCKAFLLSPWAHPAELGTSAGVGIFGPPTLAAGRAVPFMARYDYGSTTPHSSPSGRIAVPIAEEVSEGPLLDWPPAVWQ